MKGFQNFVSKILIVVVIGALLMALYHGARFFLLVFAGALIAILWRGVARWLSNKTGIQFKWLFPAVIIFNIGTIILFFWLSSPSISQQAGRLSEEIPKVVKQVESSLNNSGIGRKIRDSISENGLSEDQVKRALNFFSGTFNFFIDVLLIFAFSLFLTANPHLYKKGVLYLVSKKYQSTVNHLFSRLRRVLFRWFIGKILDMFSIFLMTIVGLWFLDMPMIFTFALIAFFFSFVPNIGPVISAIPPVAIAFLDSPQKALYVALLYLGIQFTESYFVTPNVQKKASYTAPVLLLLVQFLLAKFLGVLGLFLSTPLLIMITVTVKQLYVENYLDNHSLSAAKDTGNAS
jgi:predicted PurR-regulated permease PerM